MNRTDALSRLRACEADLRAMGVEQLSLFGSVARGEQTDRSDVDLAVRFGQSARRTMGVFEFLAVQEAIAEVLNQSVDLVTEPTRKARLQDEIDRDRVRVF